MRFRLSDSYGTFKSYVTFYLKSSLRDEAVGVAMSYKRQALSSNLARSGPNRVGIGMGASGDGAHARPKSPVRLSLVGFFRASGGDAADEG